MFGCAVDALPVRWLVADLLQPCDDASTPDAVNNSTARRLSTPDIKLEALDIEFEFDTDGQRADTLNGIKSSYSRAGTILSLEQLLFEPDKPGTGTFRPAHLSVGIAVPLHHDLKADYVTVFGDARVQLREEISVLAEPHDLHNRRRLVILLTTGRRSHVHS